MRLTSPATALIGLTFSIEYIIGALDIRFVRNVSVSRSKILFQTGLDFAWSTNGYVYHTKFDTVDQIPLGTLQRTGDNILALTQGIIFEDYLSDTNIHGATGSLVFFDFLGAFVIRWSQYSASAINIASMIIAGYSIHLNMQSARRSKNIYISIYMYITFIIVI